MQSKVTVKQLLERFGPVVDIPPHGSCIVVPGVDFDPDWEVCLADLRHRCFFGELDRRAVTFVQLKRSVGSGKVVYVPPKVVHGNPIGDKKMENKNENQISGNRWMPEQDFALFCLLKGVSYGRNRIVKNALKEGKFVGRNINGCLQRFDKIKEDPLMLQNWKAMIAEAPKPADVKDQSLASDHEIIKQVKVVPFEQIWATAECLNDDIKERAKAFYDAAVACGLSGQIVGSVLSCFQENAKARKYLLNRIEDLQKLTDTFDKLLRKNQHGAGSGQALVPIPVVEAP